MPDEEFWGRFNEGLLDRRTFIKTAALLGGAVAFGIPVVACQPAAPSKTFEMKLALSSPMLSFTSIYSGDSRKYFVQEGINNAITEFAGGSDQVRAIMTGGYPLGIASPTSGMAALEAGEKARYIAGGFDGSQVGFIVRADSPYKKPEDLKGKKFKISYSRPSSSSHILAFLGLKAVGIDGNDKDQVEFISAGGTAESWTAVKTGIIDVGWSTEPTISNVEVTKEGRALWMARDLVKDWTEYGTLTTEDVIKSHPNELKAWITAVVRALDWVKNNYSDAAKDLAAVLGIDPAVTSAALNKIPKEAWTATMRKKSWEFAAQASIDFKQLKGMPDWKTLINQSFLPENLRDPGF
ncbi:MAG: ABC transporter substrate-binding protein [Dehalococcoidia bacterium]|nr:ABC transporter substrate-binding protein [Dehalococcoidia bacterium]